MIKTATAVLACAAMGVVMAPEAEAGPYVNVENNAGWAGSTYGGSATDLHLGYESGNDVASFSIQGGPTYVQPNGGDGETILTAKIGGSVKATDKLSVYGELSAAFDDVNGYGSKVGAKYSF